MINRLRVVVATILVAAGLAGCGGATAPTHPTTAASSTRTPSTVAADRDRVQRALLAVADLPLGFQPQQDSGPPHALGCAGIDRLYVGPASMIRVSAGFAHALTDEYLNETITIQPVTAGAALAAFRQAATTCRSFTDADHVAYQASAIAGFPTYGDGSAAVRVTARIAEARPVELIAVRIGTVVLVVAHADARRVDSKATATLTKRAVDKLRRTQ